MKSGEHSKEGSERWLPLPLGEILNKRYRLASVIGEGGMGLVASARRLDDNMPVAIKFPKLTGHSPERALRRFLSEAHSASQLTSPYAVKIITIENDDRGVPFIVMERLAGESLGAHLQRETFAPVVATEFLRDACFALAEAHQLGIAHRDISPNNLFLCTSETDGLTVKLMDFGLAKPINSVESTDDTSLSELMGSPGFMAPEQIQLGTATPQADIWAMGSVLCAMLTGHSPFESGSVPDTLAAILTRPPRALPSELGVTPSLQKLIMRCLCKKPADRYADGTQLGLALARTLADLLSESPKCVEEEADETMNAPPNHLPWRY